MDISLNIESKSYCDTSKFKLALPGRDTTYVDVITVFNVMLYSIEQRPLQPVSSKRNLQVVNNFENM